MFKQLFEKILQINVTVFFHSVVLFMKSKLSKYCFDRSFYSAGRYPEM